jgi:hypothetical protein
VKPVILVGANEMALRANPQQLLPLETLAALIGVHR